MHISRERENLSTYHNPHKLKATQIVKKKKKLRRANFETQLLSDKTKIMPACAGA